MNAQRLTSADFRVEPWANGKGETLLLARAPDSAAWDWRLSSVELDHDSDYSDFSGFARTQLLVRGNGLKLKHAEVELDLKHVGAKISFPGHQRFHAGLIDGPVRVINGFARNGVVDIELMLRPLSGRMLLTPRPNSEWFGLLLCGGLQVIEGQESFEIEPGDGFRITDVPAPWAKLEGHGDLVLARIQTH